MSPANYIEMVALMLREELGETYKCENDLLYLYVLLVLVKGRSTTNEDVHEAWAVWKTRFNPHHKSLIPFEELTEEVQNYDIPYRDAILRTAERLVQ